MNNFKKGGFRRGGGGGGNFGGHQKFGGNKFGRGRHGSNRSGRPIELYPAVCAQCGKNCEVPFRPTGDKPVYCRDCFGKQSHVPGRNSNGQDGPRQNFRGDDFGSEPQSQYQRTSALESQFSSLETKVNRILEILEKNSRATTSFTHEDMKAPKAKTPTRKIAKKGKK